MTKKIINIYLEDIFSSFTVMPWY